jgi:hypothetical protein
MTSWLNANTIQGIIRALLTFGAGVLVAKGVSTKEVTDGVVATLTSNETIGAFTTVATIVWSILHKSATTTTVVTPATTSTK